MHKIGYDFDNVPKYLLLGLEEEIPAFESVVCSITMPTVDMNACLSQIFDIVTIAEEESTFRDMLAAMAEYMGRGEGLYENARLDEQERACVIDAVLKIGTALRERIRFLNMEIDGYVPYTFDRLAGKDLVVLKVGDKFYFDNQ